MMSGPSRQIPHNSAPFPAPCAWAFDCGKSSHFLSVCLMCSLCHMREFTSPSRLRSVQQDMELGMWASYIFSSLCFLSSGQRHFWAQNIRLEARPDVVFRASRMSRRRSSRACTSLDASDTAIEPLTDEEFAFCWRSLVEEGRISVPRLQKFMLDVCGRRLSSMEAEDLLSYMDANEDGRVGQEDFRYFLSVASLEGTDSGNFMWTPKAHFREKKARESFDFRDATSDLAT